jgi:hypothetical protein
MTTPAINTPNGVICDAYRDAGRLQEGQEPGSEQYADGMRKLRDVMNFLQIESGLKLWLNVDTAVPLTDGVATYTFAPAGSVVMQKPFRVLEGYYLYTSTNVRRPLSVMAWRDYLTLGQAGTLTSNRGVINSYFVDKQATQLSVTFWLCPDSTEATNGVAHVLLQAQATTPIMLTDTINFPEEWRLALSWGVAAEICTGQPQAVIDRCESKAAFYRNALSAWDVEDASTSFAPSMQMHMPSSFR